MSSDSATAHQRLVVAEAEAGGARAAVGDVEHLQDRRHVQLAEGVVVVAFVAQVEDELRAVVAQVGEQRGVVVEIAEAVAGELAQARLQPVHRLDVLRVVVPVALHRVGEARVAHDDG